MPSELNSQTFKLPGGLDSDVKSAIADWQSAGKVARLWKGDASLWTGSDEAQWLGWLGITEQQLTTLDTFRRVADDAKNGGFTSILLLGMGGSSLCPEVLEKTFGHIAGFPQLHVLDSTDPVQIKTFENKVDLAKTLFVVSSKSGSTLEPNIYKQYFFHRVKQVVGADKAGSRFVAITDPGSKLQKVAEGDHFRHIFYGLASIGGRYSALSNFGMVPASLMGIDTAKFLAQTRKMVDASSGNGPVDQNAAVVLGLILGTAAKQGRDKITIITSPAIFDLGAWLEQLIAESTGKEGHGIIPVDREALAAPSAYGADRVFAYLRHAASANKEQDAAVAALEQAGQPVVRIALDDIYNLGQEFFRWEIATAVAGAVIGINAFNQPDVEASKIVTRELTSAYEKTGSLPSEEPVVTDGSFKLFTDPKNADALAKAAGNDKTLGGYLRAHLARISAGDYFCLLAYIEMNDAHEAELQKMRHAVRDGKKVATCLGFGPRFLHSTGQAYKGGPNSGVFLQVTCDDAVDLPVPDQKYTFGIVKAAQARGDFQVLIERGRRALRVHISGDLQSGLSKLSSTLQNSLK
jgi:transaldolase / glucose-6-phosphate isomerase